MILLNTGGCPLANHKSAAKRARQAEVKSARNSQRKSSVRTLEKKLRLAITEKKAEEANGLLKNYMSAIKKSAKKGIAHSNQASRKISRLSSQVYAAFK